MKRVDRVDSQGTTRIDAAIRTIFICRYYLLLLQLENEDELAEKFILSVEILKKGMRNH